MELKEFTKQMIARKNFKRIRVVAFEKNDYIRCIGEFSTDVLFINNGKKLAAHARNFFVEEDLNLAYRISFEEVD